MKYVYWQMIVDELLYPFPLIQLPVLRESIKGATNTFHTRWVLHLHVLYIQMMFQKCDTVEQLAILVRYESLLQIIQSLPCQLQENQFNYYNGILLFYWQYCFVWLHKPFQNCNYVTVWPKTHLFQTLSCVGLELFSFLPQCWFKICTIR